MMENFESEMFAGREANKTNIEANQAVDQFSTLEETKTAKKRFYNPRHRTPEAQEAWNNLPSFLEKNKDLLKFTMGSEKVAVHMHGSMLVGMGTDGVKRETDTSLWETPPSDIDFIVFVGEKDENEKKYQEKYSEKNKNMSDDFKEKERVFRFMEDDKLENIFQKDLGRRGDGMIVRIPELIKQIKEICEKLSNKQELANEELIAIYKTSILFGSDAVFQDNNNTEAKWRNEFLKILLENPSGKIVWNGIRDYFNLYIANYEENPMATSHLAEIKKAHKKRAEIAFKEILSEMNVQQVHKESVVNALKKQRAKIQLPDFQTIQKLKDKLE